MSTSPKKIDRVLDCAHSALETMQSRGNDILYCLEEDEFYIYKEGLWQQIFDTQLIELCCSCEHELLRLAVSSRKSVIENIKMLCFKNLSILNNAKLMNLENYMLEPLTGSIFEHSKNYYSTIRIPYKYDLQAKCPLWLKTIDEIFEGSEDKKQCFQEFFGYCLIPNTTQKKALLLLGDSDSGKTTLQNALRDTIGHVNTAAVPLKFLSNPQYTPMMINKLVNIDPDVGRDAANYEGIFKIVTSGEPVNCNQKFVATFKFIPYCRIVMGANEFPRITDHSSAFYKRLIIIPCERIFSEQEKDRNLSEKLTAELSGILNWAIDGLKQLNTRGYFKQFNFSIEAIEELREDNNPMDIFIKENIEVGSDCEIDKEQLFEIYKNWCQRSQVGPLSNIRFNKCIYQHFNKHTGKRDRSSKPGRPWIWRNLRYINKLQHGQEIDWRNNE